MCPYYLDGDLRHEDQSPKGQAPSLTQPGLRPASVIPVWLCCAVFKGREEANARDGALPQMRVGPRRAPVSQNSTACGLVRARYARQARQISVDVPKDRPRSSPAGEAVSTWKPTPWGGSLAGPTTGRMVRGTAPSKGLPRKEVIQPQLPLRLPCYDFVPVSNPTLGACPPCGLAQRL